MDASNYLRSQIASWLVQGQDMPTAPSTMYVALHTGDPGGDVNQNEVTASSYSRASVSSDVDWDVSSGDFDNTTEVVFPQAQEEWGEVSYFSVWDGPDSTDNPLAYDELITSRNITTDDAAVFRIGALDGEVL